MYKQRISSHDGHEIHTVNPAFLRELTRNLFVVDLYGLKSVAAKRDFRN